MDRLTHKYEDGQAWVSLNLVSKMGENECVGLPITKLARYEDLEEQGLLLKLPCKVGDTVYLICSRYSECSKYKERFDEYDCQGCEDECDSHKEYYIHINHSVSLEWIVRNLNNFGKTVFLTQEQAEKNLSCKE